MNRAVLLLALAATSVMMLTGCGSNSTSSEGGSYSSDDKVNASSGSVPGVPFAWPFKDLRDFQPRGGTSRGTSVTLASSPSERWRSLQERGLTKKERDRRAIRAMTGSYRVSFQFTETMGFTEEYEPPKPYFSWATEHVRVIESTKDLVRLQHIIVMYYKDDDGDVRGPKVMKHWRQDWRYEDDERFVYEGNRTWKRTQLAPEERDGRWTQTVYQVDDGLRYEAAGRWSHGDGYSTWESSTFRRPLPRREYTVRDDYDLLKGTNRITITRQGWVHQQDNAKVKYTESSDTSTHRQIARELGINRYERITEPELKEPASKYWNSTSAFWKIVREGWRKALESEERFRIKQKVNGKKLYRHLFGRAQKLRDIKDPNPSKTRSFVRDLLDQYVVSAGSE